MPSLPCSPRAGPGAIRDGGKLLLCLPFFPLIGQIKVHPGSSPFGGAVQHFVWPWERRSGAAAGVAWPSDSHWCEWLPCLLVSGQRNVSFI